LARYPQRQQMTLFCFSLELKIAEEKRKVKREIKEAIKYSMKVVSLQNNLPTKIRNLNANMNR